MKTNNDFFFDSSRVYEFYESTYRWIIENFEEQNEEIFSPVFDSAFNTKWQLSINSRQLNNGNQSFSLYIQGLKSEKWNKWVKSTKCNLYVINKDNKELKIGEKQLCLMNSINKIFECEKHFIIDETIGLINCRKLTLILKIVIKKPDFKTNKNLFEPNVDFVVPKFGLFNFDDNNSRITFVVNDKKFSVNKTLLSSYSSVFAQLFVDNKDLDSYHIKDISDDVFEEVVHFINTGSVHNLKQFQIELMITSNKYGLKELEDICLNSIAEDLTANNVVKILKISNTYGIDSLTKKALVFIDKHYNEMQKTIDWKQNFGFVLRVGKNFVANK
jgi:hypothetical protein